MPIPRASLIILRHVIFILFLLLSNAIGNVVAAQYVTRLSELIIHICFGMSG